MLQYRHMRKKPNRPTMGKLPPRVRSAVRIAGDSFGVTPEAILSGIKVGKTPSARRMAIQILARQRFGQSQIGHWLGLHHTSVAYYISGKKRKTLEEIEAMQMPCPDLSGEWAI
jgi:hypothetical protein